MAAARNESGAVFGARTLRWRRLRSCAPIAAVSLASALYTLFAGNPLESQEERWRDWLLRRRAEAGLAPAVDPHVVHLDLTAADLGVGSDLAAEYRDAADMIDEASELRASAIVFDVVFGRGTRDTAQPILDAIEKARSMNCAVVLSEFLRDDAERTRSFPFRERMQPAGLINVKSDSDGVFRRYALLQRTPEGPEPSLALAAYLAWRNVDWAKDVAPAGPGSVSWEELSGNGAALERRVAGVAPTLLNFRVPWETRGPAACRHYSRAQLRTLYSEKQDLPSANASPLANRVIFVSYADPGIGDVATTPLGLNQPRTLLHTTALEDLIQQLALRRLPRWGEAAALAFLLVFGCVARFCRRTSWLLALWLAVAVGALGLSFALLVFANGVFGSVAVTAVWTAMIGAECIQRSRVPHRSGTLPGPAPEPIAQMSPSDSAGSHPLTRRVFISARSADYPHAGKVHQFLTSRGVPSFFSEETLLERGSADYRKVIDKALDQAKHMVVVASSAANVESPWVEAEWGFFLNEVRAGRKSGNLVIVAVGPLQSGDLPPGLRYFQLIRFDEQGMEALLRYLDR